ncbi:MAG: hypothetical protein AMJ53_03630 [Gammaproteobacteria bacterium SG8_11]|nr:MAG: hypothetical protein AMJ53_03630 [Gammaproteobacteria bacterium SG8_11]
MTKVMALESSRLTKKELEQLKWAHRRLEHPSFAARITSVLGSPVEEGLRLLPKTWYKTLHSAVQSSLRKSLAIAIDSIDVATSTLTNNHFHRLMAAGSGAVGGFLGPLALLAELPLMTIIMLRAIAEVAREEGEDLADQNTRIACMEVFAFGARSQDDDAAELGYYGVRTMLGLHFSSSLVNMAEGPVLAIPGGIEFTRAVAARFGMVIEDKVAVKMIPVAGAISGATLNLIFMNHYLDVARGHFIVRRLERKYGVEAIKTAYERITQQETASQHYSPVEGW